MFEYYEIPVIQDGCIVMERAIREDAIWMDAIIEHILLKKIHYARANIFVRGNALRRHPTLIFFPGKKEKDKVRVKVGKHSVVLTAEEATSLEQHLSGVLWIMAGRPQ